MASLLLLVLTPGAVPWPPPSGGWLAGAVQRKMPAANCQEVGRAFPVFILIHSPQNGAHQARTRHSRCTRGMAWRVTVGVVFHGAAANMSVHSFSFLWLLLHEYT